MSWIAYILQNLSSGGSSGTTAGQLFARRNRLLGPRKGIRFSKVTPNGVPPAMFIGSAAVTRTRKTSTKKSMVLKGTNTLGVSMDVQISVIGPDGKVSK